MQLELAIWDTAGQERFHALGPIYYRDAEAALLVYDITDIDSFRRVQTWVQELKQMVYLDLFLRCVAAVCMQHSCYLLHNCLSKAKAQIGPN